MKSVTLPPKHPANGFTGEVVDNNESHDHTYRKPDDYSEYHHSPAKEKAPLSALSQSRLLAEARMRDRQLTGPALVFTALQQ